MKTPMFKAVIFDWAGTIIDYGSLAPTVVFVETFARFGITVDMASVRAPMGLPKRDHLAAMLAQEAIARDWQSEHGRLPDRSDLDSLYACFVPLNERIAADYATLIPGTLQTVEWLRAEGIRVGTTTGYTRSIMEYVLPVAATQGFVPDSLVCGDDLAEGRPSPLGMYRSFADLGVYPPECVIKVDDTVPGIAEGTAAGCVTVGILMSGNSVGLSLAEVQSLGQPQRDSLRHKATRDLKEADYRIDTVADLPALIQQLCQ